MREPDRNPDGISQWFATPIMIKVLPGTEALNASLKNIVLRRAEQTPSQGSSNVGGWHSTNDLFEWPYPEVGQLLQWIARSVKAMTASLSGDDSVSGELSVTGWANVLGAGNYNAPHSHPNSMWSGVYYVDTGTKRDDCPESGLIEFHDPRAGVNMIELTNVPTTPKVVVDPEPGMLLLFPSWLTHFVHPYLGEALRISLAFNVFIVHADSEHR